LEFKNIDSMLSYVQNAVMDSLSNEVFNKTRLVEQGQVITDVYDAGIPDVYDSVFHSSGQRRGMDGGLLDSENIKGTLISNNTISITNETIANPYVLLGEDIKESKNIGKPLAPIIEYGGEENYDFGEGWWSKPRPFTENTIKQLESTGEHVLALSAGLKRHGIESE
jgi:hypothetical protein